jgi:hypothetical protein
MKNKEILAQIEKIKAEIEQRREENEDTEEKKKKELGAEVQNKKEVADLELELKKLEEQLAGQKRGR